MLASMRRGTMIQNPVTLVHKSPLLFLFLDGHSLSVKPTSQFGCPTNFFPLNSVKICDFRNFSSTTHYPVHLHSSGHRKTDLDQFGNGFRLLSLRPAGLFSGGRNFCSPSHSNLRGEVLSQSPAPIDYSSILQEDEFHLLADSTIQELLEKIEEYGDTVDIDGFDIDYGNHVLTVKLGSLGTYVLNKQTPNRQIWMSSPLSGPSRFDWDRNAEAWVYRRNKANLSKLLEDELERLCGKAISLS